MRSRKALFSRRRSLESRNEGGSFGVEVSILGGRSPNPYLGRACDPTIASQAMVLGGSRFARHPAGRGGCLFAHYLKMDLPDGRFTVGIGRLDAYGKDSVIGLGARHRDPVTQIIRGTSRHAGWPPSPARILNCKPNRLKFVRIL